MIKLITIVYLYLVTQMFLVWIMYRILKNPSVVDVSWSLGLVGSGLIYLVNQPFNFRLLMIAILLILWGFRLAGYLWFTRIRKGHVDKRYLQLSSNWKIAKSLGFFLNFQLQAVFILILSSVFLFAAMQSPASLVRCDYIGCCLILLGIIGESIADAQLYYFKQINKNKLCQIGLWHYSRHPNYFFELVIWLGFSLFGLQHAYGYLGFISPCWLYIIFTRMTIPITERLSIESKGDVYLNYQQTTPMLFPRFKKLANSG